MPIPLIVPVVVAIAGAFAFGGKRKGAYIGKYGPAKWSPRGTATHAEHGRAKWGIASADAFRKMKDEFAAGIAEDRLVTRCAVIVYADTGSATLCGQADDDVEATFLADLLKNGWAVHSNLGEYATLEGVGPIFWKETGMATHPDKGEAHFGLARASEFAKLPVMGGAEDETFCAAVVTSEGVASSCTKGKLGGLRNEVLGELNAEGWTVQVDRG